MVEIRSILAEAVIKDASDVNINVGLPPIIRVNTELTEMDFPIISNDEAREILL